MLWEEVGYESVSVFGAVSCERGAKGSPPRCRRRADCRSRFRRRDDFNIKVLHAFVELHEFTDLNLVQALRYAVPP